MSYVNSGDSYEQRTSEAEELIKLGVAAKRAKRYTEAQGFYEAAISIAPWYVHSYYALGKLHYLSGTREASLLNYTVATHLHLGLGTSHDLEIGELRPHVLSNYPQSLISSIRSIHPQADLLLCDKNTPRHLGHSLIDLQRDEDKVPELLQAAEAYKQTISGGFFAQLDPELEDGLYFPAGVAYLLEHIHWSKVGKYSAEDVYRLYTNPSEPYVSNAACEVELASVFDSLTQIISIEVQQTKTPFTDLLNELSLVWSRIDSNEKVRLRELIKRSSHHVARFLEGSFHTTMGMLLLDSSNQSKAFRSLMERRWKETFKFPNSPVLDFWLALQATKQIRQDTPVLRTVLKCLKEDKLRHLRDGFAHLSYSWETNSAERYVIALREYRNRSLGNITCTLLPEICEAFHGLVCICTLALDRFSASIADSAKSTE